MDVLARAIVRLAGFLELSSEVHADAARAQLERLGALIDEASPEERAALRRAAEQELASLDRPEPHVRAFFEQFSDIFGLEDA